MSNNQNAQPVLPPLPENVNPYSTLIARLEGRRDYLMTIKRVKDPELMQSALELITDLADATSCALECLEELMDGTNPSAMLAVIRCQNIIDQLKGEQP